MLLPPETTWLEVVIALLGVAGIGLSGWAATDDVADLGFVRREGMVGGPRWLSARGHLGLNAALLCYWLAYTVVALIAVHLPPREQNGWDWSAIAGLARLVMGGAVLVGQGLQRRTRTLLRELPRSAWDHFFGEAAVWRGKYHEARAALAASNAEVYQQRARAHRAEGALAPATARAQLLARLLERNGVEVPPELMPRVPEERP